MDHRVVATEEQKEESKRGAGRVAKGMMKELESIRISLGTRNWLNDSYLCFQIEHVKNTQSKH